MHIIKNVKDFMGVYATDHCGEFHSYDLVHKRFVDLRHDKKTETVDYLALNLFMFLGSWGMLRGSGFMLRKSYRFLVSVVEIVCEKKYDYLVDVDVFAPEFDREQYVTDILKLKEKIIGLMKDAPCYVIDTDEESEEFSDICKDVRTSAPSDTLVGKILLVTLGCLFAYDRLAIAACKKEKIAPPRISERGLNALLDYMNDNSAEIVAAGGNANAIVQSVYGTSATYYSQMKIMDMALWVYGATL